MNKRHILVILLGLLIIPAAYSYTGVGAAYTYGLDNGANNTGAVLTISTPKIPGTIQDIRFTFDGSDYFSFSVSDDWWVIQENLTGKLDMYIGLGFYAGLTMVNDNADFSLGGRIPLGLTITPIKYLELFLEVAPAMGLGFEPQLYFPSWNVQGALGFRVWF